MVNFNVAPLSLKCLPAPGSCVGAEAILIVGSDVAHWLQIMQGWGIPLQQARIAIVPDLQSQRLPVGLFVTGLAIPQHVLEHLSTAVRIYRAASEKLFLPRESVLVPAVTPAELDHLAPLDCEFLIWHPALGLIGFEPVDLLQLDDLVDISPAQTSDNAFDRALPGTHFNQRLLSLQVEVYPDAQQILATSQGEIGTRQEEVLKVLQQREPADLFRSMARFLRNFSTGMASLIGEFNRWMTSWLPRVPASSGSRPEELTWLGKVVGGLLMALVTLLALPLLLIFLLVAMLVTGLGSLFPARRNRWNRGGSSMHWPEWLMGPFMAPFQLAQHTMQRAYEISSSIINARQHAIDKLLTMLNDDPDEGLKYAIPFDSGAAGLGRGVAPPGSSLFSRSADFSLGRIAGGGPVDQWQIPMQHQLKLAARYRELAQREMNLGRYRRAAYIYAELLGDLKSAAQALRLGRFFREAAVLYRDKLFQLRSAAECLEEGGLLDEAIPLYLKLEEFEKAGDLYRQLERETEAVASYHDAIAYHLGRGHRLRSAAIAERKLGHVDQALQILAEGWPDSAESQGCLTEQLKLLGKLNQHGAANERIIEVRDTKLPLHRLASVAALMAGIAEQYPDEAVRYRAADSTRLIAARGLQANVSDQRSLLRTVAGLDRGDRLLERDCERFGRTRPISVKPVQTPTPQPKHPGMIRRRTVHHVPGARQIDAAVVSQQGLTLIAGVTDQSSPSRTGHSGWVAVIRYGWTATNSTPWEGRTQTALPRPAALRASAWISEGSPGIDAVEVCLNFGLVGSRVEEPDLTFEPDDNYRRTSKITFFDRDSYGNMLQAFDRSGNRWTYHTSSQTLRAAFFSGNVTHQLALAPSQESDFEQDPPLMVCGGNGLYIRIHDQIVEVDTDRFFRDRDSSISVHQQFERVCSISATEPNRRVRVAISRDEGVDIYWDGLNSRPHRVARGWRAPLTVILRTGKLIVVIRGRGQIVDLSHGVPKLIQEFGILDHEPVQVLPKQSNGFVVVFSSGEVELFELNSDDPLR